MRRFFSIQSEVPGSFAWWNFFLLGLICVFGCLFAVHAGFAQKLPAPYVDQRSKQDEYLNQISDRCRSLHTALAQRSRQRYSEYEVNRLSKLRRDYEDFCQEEVMEAQENVRSKVDAQRKERSEALKSEKE